MWNKKTNLVERRLYEYTLHAVCSPLRVIEPGATSDQLTAHVAKLFNVSPEEHEEKYMRAVRTQPCPVVLCVDIKKARNLPGEDQNGLSDPYCKVSVVYHPNPTDELANGATLISSSPPASPSDIDRRVSLFSCASTSSLKNKTKPPTSTLNRRNSHRRRSLDRLFSTLTSDRNKTVTTASHRTEIRQKTINPEWNEHFEFDIENLNEQSLVITVYDSDRGETPGMKTIVQEKRGLARKLRGLRTLFATGQIEDDFLGQLMLDIKSLASYSREQWFPLTGSNSHRSNHHKSRGEILLGLKVHFKLDEKRSKDRHRLSSDTVLEFRRRHSSLAPNGQVTSSIILRPSIFRTHFRPTSLQTRDYAKTNIFQDDGEKRYTRCDSCLTPSTDSDSPLLIEEYHQLVRIVMLHELEDAREAQTDQNNGLVIDWDGSLNELSYGVLVQFRVLYNIPVLSETLIQLLVIMELRCSEDYALFISQGVIEAYLRLFMDKVRQRTDTNDLDFTDYEKTVFKEIFDLFIDHYKQRIHNDAPWFMPSQENLPNIQSIIDTICALLQIKICSSDSSIKNHLEETVKIRIRTDIKILFAVNSLTFNNKHDIEIKKLEEFVNFVTKLAQSMSAIEQYHKLFTIFNVNYIKICFFEADSAADRLCDLTRCLLTSMTDYFQTYSKPMVKATSSIYDPNLIQSSRLLLTLYLYIQTIVNSIRKNLGSDWAANAFKLPLLQYHQWFSPIMKYLLEGFVAHIRQAMERAVEDDSEIVPDEDIVLYSQSPVAITNLCRKLCDEWELIDYPDINIRYTAMIKLTNTICEQCQHYARRTARKLSENRYFTDLNRTRSFNVSKKLCMLVNDIEYVKRKVLSLLPELLKFQNVIDNMNENYQSNDFDQTKITLERLITTAEHEMTDVIKLIFEHVADLVQESLRSKISNYYRDEKRGKVDCMKDVNQYVDVEILQHLYKGLEPVQYSRVACAIRIKVLQCLRELIPLQEPPDFYERVLQSFDQLATYFEYVCREEPHLPGPPCEEVKTFRETLQTCALTTEQLQLAYFRALVDVHPPQEYPSNNGEIFFRTAYEIANDLVTIYIFILGCHHLPRMDTFGSCDPYVILELLPSSFYHKTTKEYQTSIQKDTLDPEFNGLFYWHRLPLNVLHERGAVIRLSVWDKDIVKKDDFIGECFVPLTSIQRIKTLTSLRDVPVVEARLRKPQRGLQPRAFELIRNRAVFDEQAAVFLKNRTSVMQSNPAKDGISISSDDRNSSGSYTSSAIRSLLGMLPFINIGFGSDTTGADRSDVATDDEII